MYIYIETEKNLWTVGFYDPTGDFVPENDYSSKDEAALRVSWLNGNQNSYPFNISRRFDQIESDIEDLYIRIEISQ